MEEEIRNTKKKCPECGRTLRVKNFVVNKLKGILVCKRCDKKIGNNKWFVPKGQRRNDKIGRFNMTTEEKKVLVKSGKSWKQVNGDCKYMRGIKARKNKEFWKKKKETAEQLKLIELNRKKLIEGLK
jgi:hypothetical protein